MPCDDVLGGRAQWAVEHADCLDGLAALPERSVHCVVTSPPYWSLRRYEGVEPRVWGGDLMGCEHDWVAAGSPREGYTGQTRKRWQHGVTRVGAPDNWDADIVAGDTCARCGAWRGLLGAEPVPDCLAWGRGEPPCARCYVCHIRTVFAAVRRVLRDDGVLWINIGDSYTGTGDKGEWRDPKYAAGRNGQVVSLSRDVDGLGGGNLLGMPWRVALALQADGWVLRSAIVWAKTSVMPESVQGWRWERHRVKVAGAAPGTAAYRHGDPADRGGYMPHGGDIRDGPGQARWADCPGCGACAPNDGLVLRKGRWRPTRAHEYILMLTKPGGYFCDREAVAEPYAYDGRKDTRMKGSAKYADGTFLIDGNEHTLHARGHERWPLGGRNAWSVWTIGPEPLGLGHYAAFPTEVPKRCIAASTSDGGVCADCGAPWARVLVPTPEYARHLGRDWSDTETDMAEGRGHFLMPDGQRATQRPVKREAPSLTAAYETRGFRPTCGCGAPAIGAVVLDPFIGSGTTVLQALRMGRRAIGLDASAEYVAMARARVVGDAPLLNGV